MKTRVIFLYLLIANLFSCSVSIPKAPENQCEKIATGAGPEDFVLVSRSGNDHIFISSHNRRKWISGDIYRYDINTREVIKIPRKGEPADLFFAPHGMDYDKNKNRLYIISHGKTQNDPEQRILFYDFKSDYLQFAGQIQNDPALISPNDLALSYDGILYISNDAAKRGNKWDMLTGKKNTSVALCNPQKKNESGHHCKVAADGLGMANGVISDGDSLYVSTTTEGKLYRYKRNADGSLTDKQEIYKGTGLDNLFWKDMQQDSLLVAEHLSNWSFIKHMFFKSKSPSVLTLVSLTDNKHKTIYTNDGKEISAASGGFVYKNRLYISQVFDDFILVCK